MKILNQTKHTTIATHAQSAADLVSRSVGLLNRTSLGEGEALVIIPCNSIHMFFMKFSIDAIFVSKKNIVVGLCEALAINSLSPVFRDAHYVIECPVSTIKRTQTALGDLIELA